MRAVAITVALVMWLAVRVNGQDVPIEITGGNVKTIKVDRVVIVKDDLIVVDSAPFVATAKTGGLFYFWQLPSGVEGVKKANKFEVSKAPKGLLTLTVESVVVNFKDGTAETKVGQITFSVGGVLDPKPKTEDPKPDTPSTSPIPLSGLRALVIYETNAGPPSINLIISGEKVRGYMSQKGVKGGFLALDKDNTDEDLVAVEPWIRDAFRRWSSKTDRTHPWLICGNGKTGYEGPLPLTVAETLVILKKHGD